MTVRTAARRLPFGGGFPAIAFVLFLAAAGAGC